MLEIRYFNDNQRDIVPFGYYENTEEEENGEMHPFFSNYETVVRLNLPATLDNFLRSFSYNDLRLETILDALNKHLENR